MKYEAMVKLVDDARDSLEELRSALDERADAEAGLPFDAENPPPDPLESYHAGCAVIALQDVFEVVKALAEDGMPLVLPTEPLPLPDATLVTILANAAVAQQKMERDIKWMVERVEALQT